MIRLFGCLARSLAKHAGKALANMIPFGEVLYEVAHDAWNDYHDKRAGQGPTTEQPPLVAEVKELIAAPVAEVVVAAKEAVEEIAGGLPEPVQECIKDYLRQVPGTIRQSMRRPSDPTGSTVPPSLSLRRPEDLLALLPQRLPRFKPGDQPLPGVDWQLVELLGSGGFGEVWKALNPHMPSAPPVALKFCLDPQAAKTLRHEAAVLDRVMRQGKHAGIVPLLHTYLSADPPCLEYEYVSGGDLAGFIREAHQKGPVKPDSAARWVLHLASQVAFAHRLQPPLVHRDLKPANILIQRGPNNASSMRIADFGISGLAAGRAIGEATRGVSSRGAVLATVARGAYTPHYASPQQVRGDDPDPRDDVFALGVIWYQVLTGDLGAGRPGGRWRRQLTERGMSEGLLDLLEGCVDDHPDERPTDAGGLVRALGTLLNPNPPPYPPRATTSASKGMPTAVVSSVVGGKELAREIDTTRQEEVRLTSDPVSSSPVSKAPNWLFSEPRALVGIDLGTTFSSIAALDGHGRAITLPNRDGKLLTPSAVFIDESGAAFVGQAALDVALEQPENVATLVKRRMGHAAYGRPVAGRDFRPETLSAIILKKLVQDAEVRLGPVKQAVITVPAHFGDTRRKATQDAGRIAGLDVLDILYAPTAAALADSFQSGKDGRTLATPDGECTFLIYSLGGGTFDVSLVRLAHRHFQTIALDGDVRLGGKDWDDRIVDHVANAFVKQHGDDPRGSPQSLAALDAAAERAKRTLSKLNQATVTCTHNGRVLTVPLSRGEFEELTRDLLIRTRWTTQQVLRQSGLNWPQIDKLLLVGGSTHMPMTSQMLRDLSGKQPDASLTASEAVAHGAAIYGGIIQSQQLKGAGVSLNSPILKALDEMVVIHANAHSLGVEMLRDGESVNDVLIPRNISLPAAVSRVYRTEEEDQRSIRVNLLEGEAQQADACISIGECWIEGLPPGLPKGSPVEVRYGVGGNGVLDVTARDMTRGKSARTEFYRPSGLSDGEIAREAKWVRSLRILEMR
jgi:molecular chaperone DnaK